MIKKISKIPFKGTPEQEAELKKVIEANLGDPGAVMPVLQEAQDIYGYLPIEVQKIVADLPSPCYELLWGFYRDSLSIKELTKMFNYSNENTLKVTKHRCCEKFRKRYNELKSNF